MCSIHFVVADTLDRDLFVGSHYLPFMQLGPKFQNRGRGRGLIKNLNFKTGEGGLIRNLNFKTGGEVGLLKT